MKSDPKIGNAFRFTYFVRSPFYKTFEVTGLNFSIYKIIHKYPIFKIVENEIDTTFAYQMKNLWNPDPGISNIIGFTNIKLTMNSYPIELDSCCIKTLISGRDIFNKKILPNNKEGLSFFENFLAD